MRLQVEKFSHKSSDPKANAQLNLDHRTHHVNEATLRGFKCRINSAHTVKDEQLFLVIMSMPDSPTGQRLMYGVIYDLFGNVIYKRDLGHGFRTSAQAYQDAKKQLETIDAAKVNREAFSTWREWRDAEISKTETLINSL